mgnify:CR=1 FL=1|jgi:hypothetical protein
MEIKRASTQKPEFCDEKKPIIKKKKSSKRISPVNKIRQTAYVSDLQGKQGYVIEEHNVRSDS